MKKFIITEQDKNSILGMYGVISEQAPTTTYYLGTNKYAIFTVISAKDIPGGKELTLTLQSLCRWLDHGGLLDVDINYSTLTGKLTYTSSNGMVKLTILPTNTSPEIMKTLNYAFDRGFYNIVTTGVSIDEKDFFHDDTLVARLKNIKTPTTPVGGVSQKPMG